VLGARTLDGLRLPADFIQIPSELLYRYYAFNEWTQDIFERNEVYFKSPDGFSDPFDSKLSTTYEGTEEQRVSSLVGRRQKGLPEERQEDSCLWALDMVKRGQDIPLALRTLERSAERIRKRLGIFCMTTKRDNILMWSHYADAHTGFCLGFTTQNSFFEGRTFHVDYRPSRLCLNLIKRPNGPEMRQALLTKARDWRYEDEWRVVDHEKGPGVHQYPAEAFTVVILGCRITPNDRQRIMEWCRKRNPRPDVYWAEEKEGEFGLDIIPIPWTP